MAGNSRQHPAGVAQGSPTSPPTKGTAKYTNKDGSKFITVPKTTASTESPQPSPPAAPSSTTSKTPSQPSSAGPTQPVNRKKQKRRAKAAAKAAAEKTQDPQQANGSPSPPMSPTHGLPPAEADQEDSDDDDEHDSGHNLHHSHEDGYSAPGSKAKKPKRKKKKNAAPYGQDSAAAIDHHVHGPPPTAHHSSGISKEKIWNTSSQEERERIKEFWLGLGEEERKSLVKVEKDAVLRKMKEQQKHTCSCTVCGRKRTAIEEELEGLYDAYYEELEQFANNPNNQGERPPMMTPRHLGPVGGLHPSRGPPSNYSHQPSHGRIVEHVNDDDEDAEEEEEEEEYSDDELDEDEYSDEEPSEELPRPDYATDFFNFGNSLTVQGRDSLPIFPSFLQSYALSGSGNDVHGSSSLGGILTVADDLLKNDGKKFIEMMEQLAERRMAREEDAKEQYAQSRNYGHVNGAGYGHNHPPAEEEEYDEDEEDYEEEDEEEYDSQDEEVPRFPPASPTPKHMTG